MVDAEAGDETGAYDARREELRRRLRTYMLQLAIAAAAFVFFKLMHVWGLAPRAHGPIS